MTLRGWGEPKVGVNRHNSGLGFGSARLASLWRTAEAAVAT